MDTMGQRKTQAERSEATRGELIRVARDLFTDPGYNETSLDVVAERAGVTKGALYHHFKNKRELFQAVFEQLELELCDLIVAAAGKAGTDVLAGLRAGVEAFLRAGVDDPAIQRVVLLDGPTVLGWETWKEIDERYGYGLTKATIELAMEAGVMHKRPAEPLAHLFLASLSEAAIQIARAEDQEQMKEEMSATLWALVDSLLVKS
jgi:AcrR family transcriptional regulator